MLHTTPNQLNITKQMFIITNQALRSRGSSAPPKFFVNAPYFSKKPRIALFERSNEKCT